MSRHLMHNDPPTYVGWDQPLTTFFVQVYGDGEDADGPTLWLGASPGELYDMEDLVAAFKANPSIPFKLTSAQKQQLYADRDEGR